MAKGFYAKWALGNLKKNRRMYLPYALACTLTVTMFYMIASLAHNGQLREMPGGASVGYLLGLGSGIVGIFAAVFLFYTYGFIIKRRKKELGLYNMLGMDKRHVGRMLAWETFFTAFCSTAAGLGAGIALDKLMFLIIACILHADYMPSFFVSPRVLIETVVLFACVFVAVWLCARVKVQAAQPVELLRGESEGEREPKTNKKAAAAGVLCLAGGYACALFTKNANMVIELFFIAVLAVIAGTYLLFTSGSVALLKRLRKHKKFYYKTNRFIGISGMMHRMKQNGVGLANICILATMLLVTVSTTASFIVGRDDMIAQKYPYDIAVEGRGDLAQSNALAAEIRDLLDGADMHPHDERIERTSESEYTYSVNLSDGREAQLSFYTALQARIKDGGIDARVTSRAERADAFMSLYGGLFFLGVYLGALFLAATVLIMYYKQISEGFEDRKRFAIMQKVGLRYDEIKRCIASQILSVFFLPLLAAGVHVLFAFPMIGRLLGTMGFFRTDLFARATLACFGCFSLIYVAVYLLTASAYYKIVRENPMTPAL